MCTPKTPEVEEAPAAPAPPPVLKQIAPKTSDGDDADGTKRKRIGTKRYQFDPTIQSTPALGSIPKTTGV